MKAGQLISALVEPVQRAVDTKVEPSNQPRGYRVIGPCESTALGQTTQALAPTGLTSEHSRYRAAWTFPSLGRTGRRALNRNVRNYKPGWDDL